MGLWAVALALAAGCSRTQPNENQGETGAIAPGGQDPQTPAWRVVDSLMATPDAPERMLLGAAHLRFRPITLPGAAFDSVAALHALLPGLLARTPEDEDAEPPLDAAAWVVWKPQGETAITYTTWADAEPQPFPTGGIAFTDVVQVLRFQENGKAVCRVVLRTLPLPPTESTPRQSLGAMGLADFQQTPAGWQLLAFSPVVAAWGAFGEPEPLRSLAMADGRTLAMVQPSVVLPLSSTAQYGTMSGKEDFWVFARQNQEFARVLNVPISSYECPDNRLCFWNTRLSPHTAPTGQTALAFETHGRWHRNGLAGYITEEDKAMRIPRSLLVHAAQHDSFAFTLHREFRWTDQQFELAKEVLETR